MTLIFITFKESPSEQFLIKKNIFYILFINMNRHIVSLININRTTIVLLPTPIIPNVQLANKVP